MDKEKEKTIAFHIFSFHSLHFDILFPSFYFFFLKQQKIIIVLIKKITRKNKNRYL